MFLYNQELYIYLFIIGWDGVRIVEERKIGIEGRSFPCYETLTLINSDITKFKKYCILVACYFTKKWVWF
jgi:hypothetical protein